MMYPGAGLLGGWQHPDEEERLFFDGYGAVQIDRSALAYYRCERIVADIAAFCQQLLLADEGGGDRLQALHWLRANFAPGGTLELAYKTGNN
ncbi:MAG: hypothetical protein R2844_17270 [Caldilineales bacterium]